MTLLLAERSARNLIATLLERCRIIVLRHAIDPNSVRFVKRQIKAENARARMLPRGRE